MIEITCTLECIFAHARKKIDVRIHKSLALYCTWTLYVVEIRKSTMAAVPKTRRPTLLSKLEGHTGSVNRAKIIRGEDAVITVSDDKYVRSHHYCRN